MTEEGKIEMDQLRDELPRRPAQMTMYPAPVEEKVKLTFAGNEWENSMEFLTNCGKVMEKIGSTTDDNENTIFLLAISKIQQHSGIL